MIGEGLWISFRMVWILSRKNSGKNRKLDIQLLQNKLLTYDYIDEDVSTLEDYKMINKFFVHLKRFDHSSYKKNRKIRVGYVSPELRMHVVELFLENIFQYHNKERFEIYCYSNSLIVDETTLRLQQLISNWFNITKMSDEDLAKMIFSHNIDILIDTSGHTAENRLSKILQ